MPKVLCKLPNASENISGVKFVSHQDGMLSEEISDDVVAAFLEVPGYELAVPVRKKDAAASAVVETAGAELTDADPTDTAPVDDAAAADKAAKKAAKQAAAAAARA
jgi:hypothetical protein